MDIGDIKSHEIIKVLVDDDGIEDYMWAKVIQNEVHFLFVTYLVTTEKVYKGACVYQFEPKVSVVELDSISEHHEGVIDLADVGFSKIQTNMFVEDDEVDDDAESIIEDLDDDDSLGDFVVEDDPVAELPPDARQLDVEWSNWSPGTFGGQYFKSVVDRIEERARAARDEAVFLAATGTSQTQSEVEPPERGLN
jgi:hypothetical protein